MVDVIGETAQEVIEKSIDWVLENGQEREVWGGTIPEEFGEDEEPNDYKREMVEYIGGFSYRLENPQCRWSTISNHWVGITLREVEDDLFAKNPGMVHEYSSVYPEWLQERRDGTKKYPHTYGERIFNYGKNHTERSDPIPSKGPISYTDKGPYINQWESCVSMLKKNPTTRKANIVIWDPHIDSRQIHHDTNAYVPCNIRINPTIRDGKLHFFVSSRSKDILRGSTENLFEFPLLQELMASELGVDIGHYVETIDNLHIYQDQIDDGYLDFDLTDPYDHYNPTQIQMNPWENGLENWFSKIDDELRNGEFGAAGERAASLDDQYWRDWKLALVLEYARLNGMDGLEEFYKGYYQKIESSWKLSLAARASDEFGDPQWVYDGIPSEFHNDV